MIAFRVKLRVQLRDVVFVVLEIGHLETELHFRERNVINTESFVVIYFWCRLTASSFWSLFRIIHQLINIQAIGFDVNDIVADLQCLVVSHIVIHIHVNVRIPDLGIHFFYNQMLVFKMEPSVQAVNAQRVNLHFCRELIQLQVGRF
ncbi:hypothetical protein D3C86_1146890 [compost metagenome]